MVLDTSAIVAAISSEPDEPRFREVMYHASTLTVSSVTVLETRIVLLSRHGHEAVLEFNDMLQNAGVVVVPFDAELSSAAFDAFQRYGKGRGHPAQLNIVDCVVYALAKARDEPLLFKGSDFAATDVQVAL